MDKGRVNEMANIVSKNPEMLLKLAATSMGLSVAIAKLYSYQATIVSDIQKDIEYYDKLKLAYIESASDDLEFAERFISVSAEADKILMELDKLDDDR